VDVLEFWGLMSMNDRNAYLELLRDQQTLTAGELRRLRTIEAQAQSVADAYDDSGAAWFCELVTALRTSLDTKTKQQRRSFYGDY
jgi:hypothetical protein